MVQAPYDPVYGINGGLDNGRFNDFGYENGRGPQLNGTAGSTALYHHNGSKYGLSMNGRQNGDSKMNGLHGPKHKRGDIDGEYSLAMLRSVTDMPYHSQPLRWYAT